jgi:hypothetical protein
MTAGLLHRLDGWARDLLPALTTVVFLVLSTVRIPMAGFRTGGAGGGADCGLPLDRAPTAAAAAVRHLRHRLRPGPAVRQSRRHRPADAAGGLPGGAVAAPLPRRQALPDGLVGLRGLVAAATFLVLWAAVSALSGVLLDPRETAFRCLVTVACYPLFAGLLLGVQRAFMARN